MFAFKKKYFFIIETIKDLDLKNIKKSKKFIVIYRRKYTQEDTSILAKFRNECKTRSIKFYVANDYELAFKLKSDGIYISAYNKDLKYLNYKNSKFDIIGSAHNIKEINEKIKQNCTYIILSRLFLVDYKKELKYLGLNKFNQYSLIFKNLLPLGGIKLSNLNKMKLINSNYICLLSEIKKKPAIISRLF